MKQVHISNEQSYSKTKGGLAGRNPSSMESKLNTVNQLGHLEEEAPCRSFVHYYFEKSKSSYIAPVVCFVLRNSYLACLWTKSICVFNAVRTLLLKIIVGNIFLFIFSVHILW